MARSTNPYRPGFNAAPPTFVGRERLIGAVREALAVAALDGRTPRPIIITGTRGVGKTVALGEAGVPGRRRACVAHRARGGPSRARLHALLTERLNAARHVLEHTTVDDRRHPVITGGKLGASALGVGAEVEVHLERHGSGPVDPLEAALGAAMRVAMEEGAGLVITIDEVQYAERAELAGFTAILQERMAENRPSSSSSRACPPSANPGAWSPTSSAANGTSSACSAGTRLSRRSPNQRLMQADPWSPLPRGAGDGVGWLSVCRAALRPPRPASVERRGRIALDHALAAGEAARASSRRASTSLGGTTRPSASAST